MRLSIVAALLCGPTFAGDTTYEVIHDAPPGADWYARIVIDNGDGSLTRDITLETDRGPVTIRYTTTGHDIHRGGDLVYYDDRAEVIDWPEGVIPDPHVLDIPELEAGEIYLRIWVGL